MGDRYRDYLKAQKKAPVAGRSAARSRRSSEEADKRSKAIKRQQSRQTVYTRTFLTSQGRLDGW